MNRTDHTPGPWTVHVDGLIVLSDGALEDREPIAQCVASQHGEANARLIAAAPALLALAHTISDSDQRRVNWKHLVAEARALRHAVEGA
jgi:hypothetical protein